jgi:hypothetical protein
MILDLKGGYSAACVEDGDVKATMREVIKSSEPGSTIVVCGSFYIMREALEALGVQSEFKEKMSDNDALYDQCINL